MLKTGCILYDYGEQDGMRISIMSRHNANRKGTSETGVPRSAYDEWWKDLAPPKSIMKIYEHGKISWADFAASYLKYLDTIPEKIEELAIGALGSDLRLLCIEETPEKCHRKLLAERCKSIFPELEVEIK